ncbi:hypothetical protein HDU76_002044 [Blyttiomyces sp. JEL0837]|nr:hypothetical protein HDU76_002044 [Blyttiomyces sp. JEL0837]
MIRLYRVAHGTQCIRNFSLSSSTRLAEQPLRSSNAATSDASASPSPQPKKVFPDSSTGASQSSKSTPFSKDPWETLTHRNVSSDHPLFPTAKSQMRSRIMAFVVAGLLGAYTFAVAIHNDAETTSKEGTVFENAGKDKEVNEKKGMAAMEVTMDQMKQVEMNREKVGVWVWGRNQIGGAGSDAKEDAVRVPRFVNALEGIPLRDLNVGNTLSAAVDAHGDLLVYGSAVNGISKLAGKDIVQVSCSNREVFAVTRSGKLLRVDPSQLPVGDAKNASGSWMAWLGFETKQVGVELIKFARGSVSDRIKSVAVGEHHIVALGASGKVFTAPLSENGNGFGQLGNGEIATKVTMADLSPKLSLVQSISTVKMDQIAAGRAFNVVLSKDGDVYVWGSNKFGQLGTCSKKSEIAASPEPQPMLSLWNKVKLGGRPNDVKCVKIAAAGDTAMFVVDRPDKTEVLTVGMGQWGQLGHGNFLHLSNCPCLVNSISNLAEYSEKHRKVIPIRIASIAMSATHSAAILDDARENVIEQSLTSDNQTRTWWSYMFGQYPRASYGRDLMSWGQNDCGQLGRADGKKGNSASPVWVKSLRESEEAAAKAALVESEEKNGEEPANYFLPEGRLQVAGPGYVNKSALRKGYESACGYKMEQRVACGEGVTAVYFKILNF